MCTCTYYSHTSFKHECNHYTYILCIHVYVHCKLMHANAAHNDNMDHACAQNSVRMIKAVFRVRSSSHTCRVHGDLILNALPNAPSCIYSSQSQRHHFIFGLYHPACNVEYMKCMHLNTSTTLMHVDSCTCTCTRRNQIMQGGRYLYMHGRNDWLLSLGIANSATQTAQMVRPAARCMTAGGNQKQPG